MTETRTRKPKNGEARRCRACRKVVFWFVPSKDGPPFSDMVLSPHFGKITKNGYFCLEHWEEGAR